MVTITGNRNRRWRPITGFTLVEVMAAMMISAILVTGLISLLSFNFAYQNQQELRASAADSLVSKMESLEAHFLFSASPETILVYDNRTPDNPYDDTTATLRVQMFHRDGSELTAAPPPTYCDRLLVVITVRWHGRGRFQRNRYQEQLIGYLIP